MWCSTHMPKVTKSKRVTSSMAYRDIEECGMDIDTFFVVFIASHASQTNITSLLLMCMVYSVVLCVPTLR